MIIYRYAGVGHMRERMLLGNNCKRKVETNTCIVYMCYILHLFYAVYLLSSIIIYFECMTASFNEQREKEKQLYLKSRSVLHGRRAIQIATFTQCYLPKQHACQMSCYTETGVHCSKWTRWRLFDNMFILFIYQLYLMPNYIDYSPTIHSLFWLACKMHIINIKAGNTA